MVRIAHLSDLHVSHLTANLVRIGRLMLPRTQGEGAWDVATRLIASSWFERRSVWEPLLRSLHLAHAYSTRNLVAVVQSAREQGCQHVVLTGDVANLGAASEMREAKLVLSAFGYDAQRLTAVPGNHDVINFHGVAEFCKVMDALPWPHLQWISDDVVALALDSTAYGSDLDWRDALSLNARGLFSERTIEQADELLGSVPRDAFKILCCHHHVVDLPPDGYVDEWSGKVDPRQAGPAERSGALLEVALKHGVGLILFGHRHRATHHLFAARGIPASCSGAVTMLDRQGRLRYRIFDIENRRIVRRRWVDAFPHNASSEVVVQALQGVSAVQEDEELRLTEPVSLRHIPRDLSRLRERRRKLDRQVLEKVKARMAAGKRG